MARLFPRCLPVKERSPRHLRVLILGLALKLESTPARRSRPQTGGRNCRDLTNHWQEQEPSWLPAPSTSRTTHLLALMKQGDDAFNDRDFAVLNEIHHPDMVAYVTGNAEPIYGSAAHAAMVQQMFRIFPDVRVHNDPYPVQFGSGDWITVVTRTTGTFTGEMTLPDGTVVPPTGKAFDLDFGQTSKWQGDQLIAISAFWDSALQARQIGLG